MMLKDYAVKKTITKDASVKKGKVWATWYYVGVTDTFHRTIQLKWPAGDVLGGSSRVTGARTRDDVHFRVTLSPKQNSQLCLQRNIHRYNRVSRFFRYYSPLSFLQDSMLPLIHGPLSMPNLAELSYPPSCWCWYTPQFKSLILITRFNSLVFNGCLLHF